MNIPDINTFRIPDTDYESLLVTPDIIGAGESTFTGLKDAVEQLRSRAPKDHDVVVIAFNVVVRNVGFIDPNTLVFSGLNGDGHSTVVFVHCNQLVAHVVSRPTEKGKSRVITGFAPNHEDAQKEDV